MSHDAYVAQGGPWDGQIFAREAGGEFFLVDANGATHVYYAADFVKKKSGRSRKVAKYRGMKVDGLGTPAAAAPEMW